MDLPKDELLKQELAGKFSAASSYIGSHVKSTIQATDFKILRDDRIIPTKLKKGDVFTNYEGVKRRPCVVCNILKDGTVIYIALTSTENIHNLTESKSRFYREGYFSKSFSVCTTEHALENFIGVYDNSIALNKAIRALKQFIINNLKE